MSYWIKVSVKAATDPTRAQAGLDGLGLWLLGQCYCGTHHSDGFIPQAVIPDPKLAARLVKLGIWQPAEGGFTDPSFLVLNDDRVTAETQLKKKAARMACVRNVSGHKRDTDPTIDTRQQTLDARRPVVAVPPPVARLVKLADASHKPTDPEAYLKWVEAQSRG
jgi:hypothetical protein